MICSVCRKYHKSPVDRSPWVSQQSEDSDRLAVELLIVNRMWSPVARVYVAYWLILSVESRTNLGVYLKGHAREGRVMTSRKAGCKARRASCLGDVGDGGAGGLPSPPSLRVHIVYLNVRKIRQVVVFARSTFLTPPPPNPRTKKQKQKKQERKESNINACFICLRCKTLRRHKIGCQIIYRT